MPALNYPLRPSCRVLLTLTMSAVACCAAVGCAGGNGGAVGNVTAFWPGDNGKPGVNLRRGVAAGGIWSPRYDLAFVVDDNSTLSVDRGAAVAVLLRGRAGDRPAVVKLGSPFEPSTVNFLRKTRADGQDQFQCRLYGGAVQVFLEDKGDGQPLPATPDDARLVVSIEDDRTPLLGLPYGSASAASNTPTPRVIAGETPVYLSYWFGTRRIGAGHTTFVVGSGLPIEADEGTVYCATEPGSTVVAQRAGGEPVIVPGDKQIVWKPLPPGEPQQDQPAERDQGEYERVVAAIRAMDQQSNDELNRRLAGARQYRAAYNVTRRVAGIGRSYSGIPGAVQSAAAGAGSVAAPVRGETEAAAPAAPAGGP